MDIRVEMQKTRWDGEGGHENGEMEKNSFVEKKKKKKNSFIENVSNNITLICW